MNKKLENSLKLQLSEKMSSAQYNALVKEVSTLHGAISDLKHDACPAMQRTIKNCLEKGDKYDIRNIVQFDYILKRSSKAIFANSKKRNFEYENAKRANSLIFNEYRNLKFKEKYDRLISDFYVKNESKLSGMVDENLQKNITPSYDKFLDSVIEECKFTNSNISKREIKEYLNTYETIYSDLFIKQAPTRQILEAVGEMTEKLKGDQDLVLTYDEKTGHLIGFSEILIGNQTSIEEAKTALRYYVACSEYFEKQKIAIVLQLSSNKNFAKSICYPSYKGGYTDILKRDANVISNKYFKQYFGKLAPDCFDDIETLKTKTLTLEKVRSLLVSVSAFLEIGKKIYLDDYRAKTGIDENLSEDEALNCLLKENQENLFYFLNNQQCKIDQIVNISVENPITCKEDVEQQLQAFTKYTAEALRGEAQEYLKEYLNLSREGYKIIIPSEFDLSDIKSSAIKALLASEIQKVSMPTIVKDDKNLPQRKSKEEVQSIIDEIFSDTIGLGYVKQNLFEHVYSLSVLPRDSIFRDLAFLLSGNPGSGKSMTAHKIHDVLYKTGVLSKDKIFDDVAASLKAGYVGQTTTKIDNIFKEYAGGTVFIDEADSLFKDDKRLEDSYSSEAKSKFIKLVEQRNNDTATILACYDNKLQELFRSNPGIYRRFSGNLYRLPDYTPEQLLQMCDLLLKTDAQQTKTPAYVLADKAQSAIKDYFVAMQKNESAVEHKENASIVKRTVYGVLKKHMLRSDDDKNITEEDVLQFVENERNRELLEDNGGSKIIGFCEN